MIVALIASRKAAAESEGGLVGDLSLANAPLIEHQMRLALELGSRRIICLADRSRPSLVRLQRLAEAEGVSFVLAERHQALAGLVNSADRLLVLAEGMVADSGAAKMLLSGKPAIVSAPTDKAIPLGFERIDRDRAWAGAMILRGSIVEQLNDLPGDVDSVSSLLRLGLQSGTPILPIDPAALATPAWCMVQDSAKAREWSRIRIERSIRPEGWLWPGNAIADRATKALAQTRGLPDASRWAARGTMILLLAAGVLGAWFEYPTAGFCALAGAALAGRVDRAMASVSPFSRGSSKALTVWNNSRAALVDIALVVAIGLAVPSYSNLDAVFAAAMLIGLLRLAALLPEPLRVMLLEDRALLAIVLAGAAGALLVLPITQLLSALVLGMILLSLVRVRLTQA